MSRTLGPKLGPLSNREADFRAPNILVAGKDGRLQSAPFIRHGPTVPNEILAEIFVHCLPGHDFVSPDLATAPLVLCGMCRRWREVATSTPRLELLVYIDFDLRLGGAYETGLYQTWLSRAGVAPLSLSLQEDGSLEAGLFVPLLQRIIGPSPQWRHIEVSMGYGWARFAPVETRGSLYWRSWILLLSSTLSPFPSVKHLSCANSRSVDIAHECNSHGIS
ncbi:hypothetical protein C8R47DRAFT_456797 [Mycena vitilis]|nr:hypothetical protein C8R47DRAFT_456797 [Mycena vitilis]